MLQGKGEGGHKTKITHCKDPEISLFQAKAGAVGHKGPTGFKTAVKVPCSERDDLLGNCYTILKLY